MPGRDCVIFVGRAHGPPTTLRDVRSGREGVPVCDASPRRARGTVAPTPRSPPNRRPRRRRRPGAQAAAALADTGSALDAVEPTIQMRVDLRNLVRSQDTYFGTRACTPGVPSRSRCSISGTGA